MSSIVLSSAAVRRASETKATTRPSALTSTVANARGRGEPLPREMLLRLAARRLGPAHPHRPDRRQHEPGHHRTLNAVSSARGRRVFAGDETSDLTRPLRFDGGVHAVRPDATDAAAADPALEVDAVELLQDVLELVRDQLRHEARVAKGHPHVRGSHLAARPARSPSARATTTSAARGRGTRVTVRPSASARRATCRRNVGERRHKSTTTPCSAGGMRRCRP